MIITIAGIKRSGSTAQFNMVRCLLDCARIEYTTHGQPYNAREFGDVALVKVHKFDNLLFTISDYIFTTDRADKEILESLEAFSGGASQKRVDRMRLHLKKWNRKAHCFNYNLILTGAFEMMECMAGIMGLGLSDSDIERACEAFKGIKPPKKGYDSDTFLFHNHRR